VIARMNERGIVLDTAHANHASTREFIRASAAPVADSHTTSTSWCRNPAALTTARCA